MTEEKELLQLKKRLLELAGRSYDQGIYTFTPFLGQIGRASCRERV